ncbi:CPBP family intramembrane glutamic endopeptidase [Pseudoxanthomonas gei]|uniref:CPBP family intramembrane glutamic endopeptidase n=1 Tax=Pseudoxanthomonas gei TaxID=1383030 RepID=UPI0031B5DF52
MDHAKAWSGAPVVLTLRVLRSPLMRMLYFALLLAVFALASTWVGRKVGIPANDLKAMSANPASTLLVVLPFVLAHVVLARLIERRPLHDLAWRKSPQLLWGMLAALLLFGLLVLELWAAGAYAVVGVGDAPLWTLFLLTAVVPGITEEIVSRGILFRLTEEGLGTWIAVAVSALFFGFAHSSNPGASAWSSTAIALEAGVLFGLLYHVTRSLWWCIGLHAGWNFVQGALFGIPVSGIGVDGVLESTLQGPDWLDGGGFGAEASALTVLTCGIISLLLARRIMRAHSTVPPFWKRPPAALPQPHSSG